MISTILAQAPWLVRIALLVAVLVGPFLARWLYGRRRLAWILAAASLVLVLLVTLLPDGKPTTGGCAQLAAFPSLFAPEPGANVLLFVLPVLAAGVASRRPVLFGIAGSVLSVLIEATQSFVHVIGRSCDPSDWIANTVGAVLGALLAIVGIALGRRRPRPRR